LKIAKAILCRMSNTEGITIPEFKLHSRAIAIKIVWYWHKNRHENQGNRRPIYKSIKLCPIDF
jgi:hypothetical protein